VFPDSFTEIGFDPQFGATNADITNSRTNESAMRSSNPLKFLIRNSWILFATVSTALAGSPHYVFAHYMVCYALYGETVAGYQQEIQDAQAAGIDGFALDVGEWNGPDTYYKTRVESIYEAAEGLNSGFKLFFSVDMSSTNDIVQMISAYANRPNSFYYKGGLVVSSFCGNGLNWTNGVFQPLQALGLTNIFFVPFFTPEGYSFDNTMAGVGALLSKYSFLNGLFNFGAGLPGDISFVNNAYFQACTNAGKLFMAGVSPSYWGYAQYSTGRTYFESQGGEGMAGEWNWVIQNQPDWVELVTWNDLTEGTYINPLVQPNWNTYQYNTGPCRRFSHNGYLELSKRYINWYKTGQPPATNQDVLFYFYRAHFTNAVAGATNEVPVSVFMGTVQDVIYTTTLLTAPATLEIASGTNHATNTLPAGLSNLRTPFAAGAQQFTLRRNGAPLLTVQGSNIAAQIQYYDYFTCSGYAYGSNTMAPPTNLHVIGN
jgi:hypothetical protein